MKPSKSLIRRALSVWLANVSAWEKLAARSRPSNMCAEGTPLDTELKGYGGVPRVGTVSHIHPSPQNRKNSQNPQPPLRPLSPHAKHLLARYLK